MGKMRLFDAVVARQLDRLSAMLRDHSALVHPDDDAHAYLEATGQSLLAVVLMFDRAGALLRRMMSPEGVQG